MTFFTTQNLSVNVCRDPYHAKNFCRDRLPRHKIFAMPFKNYTNFFCDPNHATNFSVTLKHAINFYCDPKLRYELIE